MLDSLALGLHEDLEVNDSEAEQVAGGEWTGYWTWNAKTSTWYWTWVWRDPSGSWTVA